jgi:hypothetical protein
MYTHDDFVNTLNNRPSIAGRWISKHISVFSVQSGYKEVFGRTEQLLRSEELSFGTPACQDMSLGAEDLK